ncbi:MAG TPA: hypothetical protein VJM11_05330 [Nevskiaceae bacterium]|nr:hypothetical protein [Nevskiaceae bacterium]
MKTLLATLVGLVCLATASAIAAPPPGPHPDLDPAQTVDAMLAAMKKNTDAGIAELFRFSSPRNAQVTGPLARFTQMMKENFGDLLGHRDARQYPAFVDGPRAKIAVAVQGSDGQVHHYGFLLMRQEGAACDGCWMADAVVNLDEAPGEGPPGDDGLAPGEQPT